MCVCSLCSLAIFGWVRFGDDYEIIKLVFAIHRLSDTHVIDTQLKRVFDLIILYFWCTIPHYKALFAPCFDLLFFPFFIQNKQQDRLLFSLELALPLLSLTLSLKKWRGFRGGKSGDGEMVGWCDCAYFSDNFPPLWRPGPELPPSPSLFLKCLCLLPISYFFLLPILPLTLLLLLFLCDVRFIINFFLLCSFPSSTARRPFEKFVYLHITLVQTVPRRRRQRVESTQLS